MDEESADGSGKLFLADAARLAEIGRDERANPLGGDLNSLAKLLEDLLMRCAAVRLAFERRDLLSGELLALGVGEQAVEASGDVAKLKGDRRQAVGVFVDLGAGQRTAPFGDVFFGEFERVKDSSMHCRDFRESSAEPGFYVGFSHIFLSSS